MEDPRYDVVSIGNALVDVLAHSSDEFLQAQGLVKGTMSLIDTERAEQLYDLMGPAVEMSGGSAANTAAGVAGLGGRAAFIGRVADDQLGAVFGHDLRAVGVTFRAVPATDGPPTGRCLILVTPDAERTLNTFLGASALLGPDDIDAEVVEASAVTYLEGYLFDTPANREAYRKASTIARAAGRRVAVTLSDVFCVERHRDEWLSLLVDHVDVLFANELELLALYETERLDAALDLVRGHVPIACVTRGAHGSIVLRGSADVEVPAFPVEQVIDTTGAGDLYAAGFLLALTSDRSLEDCARLGSLAAAEVIGHTGARPEADLRVLAGDAQLL